MRIGVTGSTGLIGTAVTAALAARGDDVVRFVRPETPPTTGLRIRWNPARGDVDGDDLAAVGQLDGVIHLAGTGIADHRWSSSYRAHIMTSRTAATSLLVTIASRLPGGIATLVSGSAIGYYGDGGTAVLDERAPSGEDYVAEVCRAWEAAAAPVTTQGTVVSYARTGIVMTPAGGALGKLLPLFRWGVGGRLGSGRQWMSPISMADEVRALLFMLDTRLSGPVNIVAPEPCTNAALTTALGAQLRRPTLVAVPAPAMRAVLGTECANATVLTSQRVVPTVLLEHGFTFQSPTIAAILRDVL